MTDERTLDQRLRVLAALLPRLAAEDAEQRFGQWVPSRQSKPGIWSMPYVEYGPLERAFREAAAGWLRPNFNWPTWAATEDALAMRKDPERLARATPDDLAHLITTLVRSDRFNEGLLLDALQEGLLARITRRAAALVDESAG